MWNNLNEGCTRIKPYKNLQDIETGLTNEFKEVIENEGTLPKEVPNRIYDIKVTRYNKSGEITDTVVRNGQILYEYSLRQDETLKGLKNKFKRLRYY